MEDGRSLEVKHNPENAFGEKRERKILVRVLAGLCVAALMLCAIVVAVKINSTKDETAAETQMTDEEAEELLNSAVEERMAGWKGGIDESTKALSFHNYINERLESEPDYNISEAVADWEKVYNNSSGDLKYYLALEYADFINEEQGDEEKAQKILDEVKDLNPDNRRAEDTESEEE